MIKLSKKPLPYNDSLFKKSDDLRLFFYSDHIKLTKAKEYFKNKGILLYTNTKEGLSLFAKDLFLASKSLKELETYSELKANPTVSGFAFKINHEFSTNNILKDLLKILNDKVDPRLMSSISDFGDNFLIIPEVKGRIISVYEYNNSIECIMEYMSFKKGLNLFQSSVREAHCWIERFEDYIIVFFVENRTTDFHIIKKILIEVIEKNNIAEFCPISLGFFDTTKEKHNTLEQLINTIENEDKEKDIIGAIKYFGDRAPDYLINNKFEKAHRKRSNELDVFPIKEILKNLEERQACAYGMDIVYTKIDKLYILSILCDGESFKIQFLGFKNMFDVDSTLINTIDKIQKLENIPITQDEKDVIDKRIWKIFAKNYLNIILNLNKK